MRRWARAGAGAVVALCVVAASAAPSQAEPVPDRDRAVEPKRKAGPPVGAVRAVDQSEPARITSYWTARRMRRARPLELALDHSPRGGRASSAAPARPALHQSFNRFELTDTTSFPNRTHGQVFFTLPDERDFTCSGTVVTANSHSVVLTAGHCIHEGGAGSGFATNWIFVPGYRDGSPTVRGVAGGEPRLHRGVGRGSELQLRRRRRGRGPERERPGDPGCRGGARDRV